MSCNCWQMTKLKNIQKVNLIFNLIFFICSVGNEEMKWKKIVHACKWTAMTKNQLMKTSFLNPLLFHCLSQKHNFICVPSFNILEPIVTWHWQLFFHRSLSICCFYFLHKKKFPYEILCRTWNSYKKRNLWAYLEKCYQHHAKGWEIANIF